MAAIKFLLIVCLAFSAGQVQAASTAEPKAELVLVELVKLVVKLVEIILSGVEDNLGAVQDCADQLVAMCPDESRPIVATALDKVKELFLTLDGRLREDGTAIEKLITDLQASDSCLSPQDELIKQCADDFVNGVVLPIKKVIDDNSDRFNNTWVGIGKDLEDLHKFIIQEIPKLFTSWTLGNVNSCSDFDALKQEVANYVTSFAANLLFRINEIVDLVNDFGGPIVDVIVAAATKLDQDIKAPNDAICDCCAKS